MKITFLSGDDWDGVYVDGELKAENHSLDARDVLDALGIEYSVIDAEGEEFWDAIGNSCPKTEDELDAAIADRPDIIRTNYGVKK